MKKTLITILRNRNTSTERYWQTADQLGTVLAVDCDNLFPKATLFTGYFKSINNLRLRNREPFPLNPGTIEAIILTP